MSSVVWDLEPWAVVRVPYDAGFLDKFKANVHVRAFDYGTKCWYVPARYVPVVLEIAKRTMNLHLAAPGTFRGYSSAPAAQPVSRVDPDWDKLCVLPGSPIEVVKAAYKALAFMTHPDRGGNAEHFRELTSAYERIVANY